MCLADPPENLLLHPRHPEPERADRLHHLLVRVSAGQVVVEVPQRSDPPPADVAEPVHGAEVLRGATCLGQPDVDQSVAVAIRQGIGQQARQALERLAAEPGKFIRRLPQRHGERSNLDAGRHETRAVPEDRFLPGRYAISPGNPHTCY